LRVIVENAEVQTVLLSAQVVGLSMLPRDSVVGQLGAAVQGAPKKASGTAGVVRAASGRPKVALLQT